jgi:hypothetical protein
MSTPTAKDLLAQADRLMRQRAPEELPVLTDLVVEEIEFTSLTDRMDDVVPTNARPAWAPPHSPPSAARVAASPAAALTAAVPVALRPAPPVLANTEPLASAPRLAREPPSLNPNPRDHFNALLLSKLEELQHSVYNQVMQQLEIHAAGSLKNHLRETLLPALNDIAREIAEQVADDTATQVREVVSKAVDSEIARLREQLTARRL